MGKTKRFDSNDYIFNPNSKKGIYIIHGYSSSTYEVKDLAKFLANHGYFTIAKNLPGHGTTVEDCNKVTYEDWLNHVEKDVAELSSKCNEINIIGISMGSVLGLHLASLFPINTLVSAATVFKFKNEFNVRVLVPLLSWLVKKRTKSSQYKNAEQIEFTGYSEYPLKALNQMRKLTNKVRQSLKNVKCPTLLIHSKSDLTSIQENLYIVESEISSQIKEKFIAKNASHNLFCKSQEQLEIFKCILSFINTKTKKYEI